MQRVFINLILLLIMGIMVFSLLKVVQGRAQEDINIAKLSNLLNSQIKLHNSLQQEYTYYNSREYIEKVSRDNLNLVKKGEYIVVLPSPTVQQNNPIQTSQENSPRQQPSNLQEWINLFVY